MKNVTFTEHKHYGEMTVVTHESGNTYDLENSDDYREELQAQQREIVKLRKALTDALESMEDADIQLLLRPIRRVLQRAHQ
jgi:hypothetical protein|tara:strand:+ start:447 stop:689 length:243 start_codon:yes stop_codon:yes gene_type:complete